MVMTCWWIAPSVGLIIKRCSSAVPSLAVKQSEGGGASKLYIADKQTGAGVRDQPQVSRDLLAQTSSLMAGPMTRGLSSFIWRSSSLALTSRPLVVRPVVVSARRSLGDESGISGRQESFTKQGSYEGHGKTSVSILNEDCEGINMIDSFAQDGFRLSDDTKILGPCVIFPTAVLGKAICTHVILLLRSVVSANLISSRICLGWRIRGVEDINEDSLSLFTLLDPRLISSDSFGDGSVLIFSSSS